MQEELRLLEEDKAYAKARITELEKAIQDLGPEFYEVFNQSSETWHDNAPFDALRDRQSVLDAELQQLKRILRSSLPGAPVRKKGEVGIGTMVTLEGGKKFFIAGDWTPHAGKTKNGIVTISSKTPLAENLLGKRVGDEFMIGGKSARIVSLE